MLHGFLDPSGCTLPVEMFFPGKELPTAALEAALSEVGVVCRPLPDLQLQDFPPSNATDTETDLSGFTMKVAALILSRFQEASFLLIIVTVIEAMAFMIRPICKF